MADCPYCAQAVEAGARVCRSCGAALTRKCPECGAQAGVLADCAQCGASPSGSPSPLAAAPYGEVPADRSIPIGVILTIVTCGIWGLVWIHGVGSDLNRHARREVVSPTMDVVLTIVTCGLWGMYLLWRYPTALAEIEREEGLRPNDNAPLCLILGIASAFVGFTWVIALAIVQSSLNEHWRLHSQTRL